jgi:hypothetical protein
MSGIKTTADFSGMTEEEKVDYLLGLDYVSVCNEAVYPKNPDELQRALDKHSDLVRLFQVAMFDSNPSVYSLAQRLLENTDKYSICLNLKKVTSHDKPPVRHGLLEASKNIWGSEPPSYTSYSGFNHQKERYKAHGFAEARLDFPDTRVNMLTEHFIIDADALLPIAPPKYTWFSETGFDHVTVAVSTGKNQPRRGALELASNKILEGLEIIFNYRVNLNWQFPFIAEIIPLYQSQE